ncbi:MAG: hypothetical protein M0Z84_15160 [Gammaproteobacteria bacterium]|nr:hypothetical protein [Gammaproteobacteria bacterium]
MPRLSAAGISVVYGGEDVKETAVCKVKTGKNTVALFNEYDPFFLVASAGETAL